MRPATTSGRCLSVQDHINSNSGFRLPGYPGTFDDYHDALPQIREANYMVLTNPRQRLQLFRQVRVDMTYTIPPIAVQELKDSQDLVLV